VTVVPSSTHCVPNAHVPVPVAVTAIWYCVFQFQVSVESSPIVNVTFVAVPLAGTLPVPVQPVQMRRTPFASAGALTLAAMEVPYSCVVVPFAGVGVPYVEATWSV
jgi:hypothetical protein